MKNVIRFGNLAFIAVLLVSGVGLNSCRKAGETETQLSIGDLANTIKRVPCADSQRFRATKQLFADYGAQNVAVFEQNGIRNIVVTIPGKSDETITIGAHYDKVTKGCGAIDNWSGVTIIAAIYRELRNSQPDKSLEFVAFGREETGLEGARIQSSSIPHDKRGNVCAMINFDSFGFEPVWALEQTGSKKLTLLAKQIGSEQDYNFKSKKLPGATSDSVPYGKIGIPAITLTGLGNSWREYLHTEKDQPAAIDLKMEYAGFTFGLSFIKQIDRLSCVEFR